MIQGEVTMSAEVEVLKIGVVGSAGGGFHNFLIFYRMVGGAYDGNRRTYLGKRVSKVRKEYSV